MTIQLSDQELGELKLTADQARIDLAVGMYTGRHSSLGRAARIAGIPKVEFMRELGRRGLHFNYSREDVLHDLEMAEVLSGSKSPSA